MNDRKINFQWQAINKEYINELMHHISELLDILCVGHNRDGVDWLFNDEDRPNASAFLWVLAGRFRHAAGLPDPYCSVTNTITSKINKTQKTAIDECTHNFGVKSHNMRIDYKRFLCFDCRGCGNAAISSVEDFVINNKLALCEKCSG